ncbi:MAG: hypothetical protein NVSMB9_20710 [Isosphaeraceae bacterium]
MTGTFRKTDTLPQNDATGGASEPGNLMRRLAHEFQAPIGLLDPHRAVWTCLEGAPADVFPVLSSTLTHEICVKGRAVVWRSSVGPGDPVWLMIPLRFLVVPVLAVAGFATSSLSTGENAHWGPICPEPALRAWGQSVADHLRDRALPSERASSRKSVSLQVGAGEEPAERQIVARLIRRLRISDPPLRFQQMATNALRTAMGVSAVAWVPLPHSEPVVISGGIGGFQGDSYRSLLPSASLQGRAQLINDPDLSYDPELKRMISVSADSHGELGRLIVLNPLDGRFFTNDDCNLIQPIASLITSQQINADVYGDLKELLFGVIRALTAAIDAKDQYTCGHSERVARIAVRLGEELGMTPTQRGDLYLMGLLHDVGKIGVNDSVLQKAGPLTPEEFRLIQTHVQIGVNILADLKKLNHLLPGIRHHHESLDGSGYPDRLVGDAIPIEARILAVADSYDAMSSTRPYRRRLTPLQIDEILRKGSGVQWDPRVINALFACRMDLELIRQKGIGESLQIVVSETLGRS